MPHRPINWKPTDPVPGRELYDVDVLCSPGGNDGRKLVYDIDDAVLVSSKVGIDRRNWSNTDDVEAARQLDDRHAPVLDFDFPCRLVPSTHEGHFHLYIDTTMPWDDYVKLLTCMKEVGLLQNNFVDMSIKRGMTMVMKPDYTKEDFIAEGGVILTDSGYQVDEDGDLLDNDANREQTEKDHARHTGREESNAKAWEF